MYMTPRSPQQYLSQYFGFSTFREPQEQVIHTVLSGRDALVLMPTGAGKSLCYQIPALMFEGLTIVVSPLISLMKDQVMSLRTRGIAAAYLNSSLSPEQQSQVEQAIVSRSVKILYVSPERLSSSYVMNLLDRVKVSLIAVDEAHCVSTWGHDFRPEYTNLRTVRESLPRVPFLALTATADVYTRQDIVRQLRLEDPAVFISSFDRPNIHLAVDDGRQRIEKIASYITHRPGQPGIVYALSRKSVEKIAMHLRDQGIPAGYYHAGLSTEDREMVQHAFINGHIPVLCATVAFGMGIDKADIRYVIHYNLPKNMECYYQEIGRAGRDGHPSEALMFYSKADIKILSSILTENDRATSQLKKLDRMYAYADAKLCRRQMLLAYFNEYVDESCGHCDVCQANYHMIDGTAIGQKICSTIARTHESINMPTLVALLRGDITDTIRESGFHALPVFGSGKELADNQWESYIHQLCQLGYLIEAQESPHLRLSNRGKELLCGERRISFVAVPATLPPQELILPRPSISSDTLYQQLIAFRKDIAEDEQHACVMVSDHMLAAMAEKKPISEHDMRNIPGMTDWLYDQYGAMFVGRILAYIEEQQPFTH